MIRPLLALLVAGSVVLVACGDDASTTTAQSAADTHTPADDAAFPRTVTHAMGQTEIPGRPERVVVLDTGELPSVSMVRFLPGSTRLHQKQSFIGTILEDIGMPRPPSQDVDEFAAEISAEQLEMADGDIIFTTHYRPAEDTTEEELTENPLWDRLGAVQAGEVHEVPDDHRMLGIGIGAARLVLDDVESMLLPGS